LDNEIFSIIGGAQTSFVENQFALFYFFYANSADELAVRLRKDYLAILYSD